MTELLIGVSLLFVIAGPLLLFAYRLQLPVVPALIGAGIIGGFVVDLQDQLLLELAQIGIALLVFSFAVEIRIDSIRAVLADSELVAVLQVASIGIAGTGIGVAIGLPVGQAAIIGTVAAFSSTIVGRTLLSEQQNTTLLRARITQSVQFVQDLVAILIILILGAGTVALDPVATEIGYGAMLIGAAVVVNQAVWPQLVALTSGSDESLLIGMIALLVGFLGIAEAIGVSIVVGAFAAGLAIQYNPVEQIDVYNGLSSIADFFAAVLFLAVGSLVTVPSLQVVAYTAVVVLLAVVVKPIVTIWLLISRGYESRSATLSGLRLGQVSEFSLIIAIEAFVLGALQPALFEAVILAAAITMIVSSFTSTYDEAIYRRVRTTSLVRGAREKIDAWSDVSKTLSDHVIVIGYGRQGRRVVDALEDLEQPYVVIENDPAVLDDLEQGCAAYVVGDAVEPYTWEKARFEAAQLIVSTVDSPPVNDQLIERTDEVDVILRRDNIEEAAALLDAGATYVSVADLLAADRLQTVLEGLLTEAVTPAEVRAEESALSKPIRIRTGSDPANADR